MRWLDSLSHDVRGAVQTLKGAPGFVIVTLLSLGLGIGANTALFSLLNAVLLESLPVEDPDALVVLDDGSWTNPIWEAIRDRREASDAEPFESLIAWGKTRFDLAGGGETQYVQGVFVSGDYFEALGVRPFVGRTFGREDDVRGCGATGRPAVLSYGFWQRHHGGSASALGETIRLDGEAFTIVGVTPPRFFGLDVGEAFDVAVPICTEAVLRGPDSVLDRRGTWWLQIAGRVKEGRTLDQAQASLRAKQSAVREQTLPPDWPAEYQADYLTEPFTLSSARSGVSRLRDRYGESLLVLMGISALVLLVACANIANLLLARATARSRELAVRLSVGATRARLARALLIESVLVGFAGAAAGILFARWASSLLVSQLSTGARPVFLDVALDGRVLAFNMAAGILTGLLFGIYPALRASRQAPSEALSRAVRGTGEGAGAAGSRWLVSAQVGLSLVLLVGAALFVRSYTAIVTLDPGFDQENLLTVRANLLRSAADAGETDASARVDIFGRILSAIQETPGVRSAAASAVVPVTGMSWNDAIQVDGFEAASESDRLVYYNYVSPDYFRTLGTPLLAGRDIDAGDTATSPRIALVNEAMAEKFFGDAASALGATYEVRVRGEWTAVEIVGIVGDAKYRALTEEAPPTAYAPRAQLSRNRPSYSFIVRGEGDLAGLRSSLVEAVAGVSPDVALTFSTLESVIDDSIVQERLLATLSAIFGILALTVAALGLAGLVSYGVSRRRAELGIRSALGATPEGLVLLVLRDVAIVTATGLGLGALGALAGGRFVASLLYGLSPGDPLTLGGAAAALGLVAVVASLVPARRAARVDAMACLRSD